MVGSGRRPQGASRFRFLARRPGSVWEARPIVHELAQSNGGNSRIRRGSVVYALPLRLAHLLICVSKAGLLGPSPVRHGSQTLDPPTTAAEKVVEKYNGCNDQQGVH